MATVEDWEGRVDSEGPAMDGSWFGVVLDRDDRAGDSYGFVFTKASKSKGS